MLLCSCKHRGKNRLWVAHGPQLASACLPLTIRGIYLVKQGKPVAGNPGLTDLATQPTYPLPSAAVPVVTKWLPQVQRSAQATTSSSRKGTHEALATTGASEAPQEQNLPRRHQAWPCTCPLPPESHLARVLLRRPSCPCKLILFTWG